MTTTLKIGVFESEALNKAMYDRNLLPLYGSLDWLSMDNRHWQETT